MTDFAEIATPVLEDVREPDAQTRRAAARTIVLAAQSAPPPEPGSYSTRQVLEMLGLAEPADPTGLRCIDCDRAIARTTAVEVPEDKIRAGAGGRCQSCARRHAAATRDYCLGCGRTMFHRGAGDWQQVPKGGVLAGRDGMCRRCERVGP